MSEFRKHPTFYNRILVFETTLSCGQIYNIDLIDVMGCIYYTAQCDSQSERGIKTSFIFYTVAM